MRVAELDMTNSSHKCPSGLTLHTYTESDSNRRVCVTESGANCVSIKIDIPYSYGRVIAYRGLQVGCHLPNAK